MSDPFTSFTGDRRHVKLSDPPQRSNAIPLSATKHRRLNDQHSQHQFMKEGKALQRQELDWKGFGWAGCKV